MSSRPSSSSGGTYNPRWSSPLSAPPLQIPPPRQGLFSTLFNNNPRSQTNDGVQLTRTNGYTRGRHNRTISAPILPQQSSATGPPRLLANPHLRRAQPTFDSPDPLNKQFELHEPPFSSSEAPSLEARLSGTTEFRTQFRVSSYTPETHTIHSAPPRLDSQRRHDDSGSSISTPSAVTATASGSTAHFRPIIIAFDEQVLQPPPASRPASAPIGSRRPVVAPRPLSDFKTKDDESRDLLARMAAHTRSLSADQKYQATTPRISAPRENVVNQSPRPLSSVSLAPSMSTPPAVRAPMTPEPESGGETLGVEKPSEKKRGLLYYLNVCLGREEDEATRDDDPTILEVARRKLGRQSGSRINSNPGMITGNDAGTATNPTSSAPPISKPRGLRILRKSRQPSVTFDVPLTTIRQP